jgi:hypothetical protein
MALRFLVQKDWKASASRSPAKERCGSPPGELEERYFHDAVKEKRRYFAEH